MKIYGIISTIVLIISLWCFFIGIIEDKQKLENFGIQLLLFNGLQFVSVVLLVLVITEL